MVNKKFTQNGLTRMIKKGFDGVDKRFGETDKKIDNLSIEVIKGFEENKKEHQENKKEHQQIFDRLDNLENGQKEIKLKLDQVAYKFEVRELDRRLKRVEAKLGIK